MKKILRNKALISLYILSTGFFLYQHFAELSWDFSAYVLNARYLFYKGAYFETIRPPLAPLLLGLFLVIGILGEYLYIIFISILFLYANIKLSDWLYEFDLSKRTMSKQLARLIIYACSMTPYTLLYGLKEGTELLALSLLTLFFVNVVSKKNSGFYLGLAFLARYQIAIFAPFLFINKDYKKIVKNVASFIAVVSPWLIWNRLHYGNWFASIIDSYANNIITRQHFISSFNWYEILMIANYFLPFLIIGLCISIREFFSKKQNSSIKISNPIIILIIFFMLIIWNYQSIPLKSPRYLFNLLLPIGVFSSIGLGWIISKKESLGKFIIAGVLLLSVSFLVIFVMKLNKNFLYSQQFSMAAQDIKKLGYENCVILSPHWVLVTYYTENVYPLGGNDISESLEKNKIVLLFTKEHTIDDRFAQEEINNFRIEYKTENYIFLANENASVNCPDKYISDASYVDDHCMTLAERFKRKSIEKACNFINLKVLSKTLG